MKSINPANDIKNLSQLFDSPEKFIAWIKENQATLDKNDPQFGCLAKLIVKLGEENIMLRNTIKELKEEIDNIKQQLF